MIQFQERPKPAGIVRAPCRDALVRRLADDMREMAFAGENVNAETLAQRGWPEAAVTRLGPRAVEMARRASIRRVGEVRP